MTARFAWSRGVDLKGHAVARRSPRGVDYYAKGVVSRVTHVTPGLVAQCVESVALRNGMMEPVLHSGFLAAVPRPIKFAFSR